MLLLCKNNKQTKKTALFDVTKCINRFLTLLPDLWKPDLWF